MGVGVTIEWHANVDPLAPGSSGLTGEWDRLAGRCGADPFRRPDWVGAWQEAFGRGELIAIAARTGEELIGLLPLERRRRALRAPANWHTPVFGPVWSRSEAVEAIVDAVLASRPATIELAFVDESDPIRSALLEAAIAAPGWRAFERTIQRSPYLELGGGWEACWKRLGGKRRNAIRSRRRKLEARDELTVDVLEGGSALEPALEQAFAIEALGWKGRRGSAIASRPDTRRFYRRIAEQAARRGIFRLAFLRLGERAIAFDLGLEDGRSHYLLKTGYDPAYRELAPGIVLRSMMIERACSLELERYEFLGGEDRYKLQWTDRVHDRRRLHAFSPTPRGVAGWVGTRHARQAARRVGARLRP